jgi:c(7)-type cytochrome triheme protein
LRIGKKKRIVVWAVLVLCGAGLVVWDLASFPEYVYENPSRVPFDHEKHADALGLECSKCHVGAEVGIRAQMPSKADCMDCHNLPLTESAEIEKLDKALHVALDNPFSFTSLLPSNVVFPHGLHVKAQVHCETCHGTAKEIDAGRRPAVRMQDCLACHQGKRGFPKASTDCARCHR